MAKASENEQDDESFSFDHLPKVVSSGTTLFRWKGYWMTEDLLKAAAALRAQFQPLPSDVILASFPKTGTTWLKALIYTILRYRIRSNSREEQSLPGEDEGWDQLAAHNPHDLVPTLEFQLFGEMPLQAVENFFSPRIFQTHFGFEILPESVERSRCRVVYVGRNPGDTVVSLWHFISKRGDRPVVPFEETFDAFCKGTVAYGPYFDHALGYWKERERVFFITYEELKDDTNRRVAELAQFLGCRLAAEDIEDIVWRCSFERLRGVEANNGGNVHWSGHRYDTYFRRGVVGDWKNYMTEEMRLRLVGITMEKTKGSGLEFKWDEGGSS